MGMALYGAGMFIAAVYPILSPTTHVQPRCPAPNPCVLFPHAHAVNGFQPVALENLIHHLDGMAYRGRHDPERHMQFVSRGCLALCGYSAAQLTARAAAGWG
jgi:hypothetical protein